MTGTLLAQLADVATTLFCTTGLALMGWIFFGKLLTPTPRGVHIFIHSQGDGEALEQSIRSLIWLRSMGLLTCPIFIVDGGLSPQGLALAQRLCDRWDNVSLDIK